MGAAAGLQSANSHYWSTKLHPTVVLDHLQEKCRLGAIAGPFSKSPCYQLHSNHFGVIPKLVPGKCRLFTDLSFPLCFSVNDLIPDDQVSVKYVGIPEASEKVISLGHGTLLAKIDIRRAYCLLPVCVEDRNLVEMNCNDLFYVDLVIPLDVTGNQGYFPDLLLFCSQFFGVRVMFHIFNIVQMIFFCLEDLSPVSVRSLSLDVFNYVRI